MEKKLTESTMQRSLATGAEDLAKDLIEKKPSLDERILEAGQRAGKPTRKGSCGDSSHDRGERTR